MFNGFAPSDKKSISYIYAAIETVFVLCRKAFVADADAVYHEKLKRKLQADLT
ncbi:hypothetical protein L1N85_25455 [Paenibacillus alkaliterrae]|uniref:hypothetical protein n=1 Tax=Paenibacillus alkaliterrae TaxID=320909 RepID=UPI001F31CF31|nr:hypothetical protein [Paenibacillus alkaliterrae]MCF2941682.1 hypothetical protein [Paenibacillus alkaliterrae]